MVFFLNWLLAMYTSVWLISCRSHPVGLCVTCMMKCSVIHLMLVNNIVHLFVLTKIPVEVREQNAIHSIQRKIMNCTQVGIEFMVVLLKL
jgi:hypothetical protein